MCFLFYIFYFIGYGIDFILRIILFQVFAIDNVAAPDKNKAYEMKFEEVKIS
jgi:hypothetical protein